ncbi:type I-U CRISPR-associated protein Csb2 [Streptomyces sp. NPDC048442]|uniref:type I-G CRISPR-associated protein Csb2 n=1 Tax=Streptomyces sp. NPDC048442 TaxID=3154823 RepID=UPI003430BD4E
MHFLESAYQASSVDRESAEWPSHPARIFCSLVSVADPEDPVQKAALQWLERQQPPVVRVPVLSAEAESPRAAWVPVNAAVSRPGHAVLPGRTNGGKPKTWPQRTLGEPLVEFEWQAEPPLGVLAVLEMLAKAVPYVGRASGHALVHAAVVPPSPGGPAPGEDYGQQVWEPTLEQQSAEVRQLRAPYGGYLARLQEAYEQGQPAWQQARSFPYRLRGAPEAPVVEVVAGPYEDVVVFAFPPSFSLDAALTMAVTGSLRSKVMGMLEEAGHDVEAMVAVHGHKAPGESARPCAYLALPFVGHRHADGRLRGVAVALPHGLDPGHRRALLAMLLRQGGGLRRLAVPTLSRPVPLTYVGAGSPVVETLKSVRPERWTQASARWATALPMVMDRFPKRNSRLIEESVAVSCRLAGLPQPIEVEVLAHGAYVPGARELPVGALRRKAGERPLPARHVRVRFDRPVQGPVVLGSKKNFGLGLCLPIDGWRNA